MRRIERSCYLLLLFFSPPAFAHGGAGMEALVVWFYLLVALAHGIIVLLLRNAQKYKYLWLVLVSLLFSLIAIALLWATFSIVTSNVPKETVFLIASIIGLIIHAFVAIWAFVTPIKQYRQYKNNNS